MWYAYEKFKEALTPIVFRNYDGAREVPDGVAPAFKLMTESFEKAFGSIQLQVFEELRNEAIRVKLERMKQAANLLAANADVLPDDYAARTLRDMASKLECLTQYAVGPAFDQQEPGPAPILDELPLVELPSVLDGKKR